MRKFLVALSFFTRVPIKLKNVSEDEFYNAMILIPLVGVIIGFFLFAAYGLLTYINLPRLSAILLIILYIWITGGLHLDGLADTVDALFSARDRERMMEIMKDSRLGAFGAIGLLLLFMVLWTDYEALGTASATALIMMPVIGRYNALQSCCFSTYAEGGGGLGKRIVELTKPHHIIIYGTLILAFGFLLTGFAGLICIVITALLNFLLMSYLKHKFGGITGDTIGFTIELTQAIYLTLVVITAVNFPEYI